MTPHAFKANPALWYHPSTNLDQMLSLLWHLANDGNVTVALLAADFAERTLPYAGSSKPHATRCVTAVRTWAKGPTDANLQECKDAAAAAAATAHAAATAAYAATAAAYAAATAYAYAYAANAAANAYAYAAANAANAAANAYAYAYANAYANANANARAAKQAEQNWQLAHVRTKHPLTEL